MGNYKMQGCDALILIFIERAARQGSSFFLSLESNNHFVNSNSASGSFVVM